MSYTSLEIWVIIIVMGAGTFLIRFSFLGPLGRARLSPLALRLLRYTPVAVIPGLVAPLVLWPAATGGQLDAARILAALVVTALGMWTKNVIAAIFGGAAMLYLGLYLF